MSGINRLTQLIGVLVIANSLYFAGCKKENNNYPPYTTRNVDADEIYAIINVYPMNGAVIADTKYALVTKEWVVSTLANTSGLSSMNWIAESGDCDSFTIVTHAVANKLFWNNTGAAVAVGEFYYIRDWDSRAHAVNVFLYQEGDEVKAGFFEPQLGKIITLSQNEINSCSFWKI